MRFSINLSSEPYENLRPLRAAVALLALLAVVLSLTVGWKARHNRGETRVLAEQSDQLDQDLVKLREDQRVLTKDLARPQFQEIRDRSTFLNSLIIRKSLSWSQLFMDLEKVLPDLPPTWNVRSVSWVPGSPMLCAAITPTASPLCTIWPVARLRP